MMFALIHRSFQFLIVEFSLLLCIQFVFTHQIEAQKRSIQHSDYDDWNKIRYVEISNNGNYISYLLQPGYGDATLILVDREGQQLFSYERAQKASFTFDNQFLIFKVGPSVQVLDSLKRLKTKSKDLPTDTLVVFDIGASKLKKFENVLDFKIPEKWSDWMAFRISKLPQNEESDSLKKKPKAINKKNGYPLYVFDLINNKESSFNYITDYTFSEKGHSLVFQAKGLDSTVSAGVYLFDTQDQMLKPIKKLKEKIYNIALNRSGDALAFVTDQSLERAYLKNHGLFFWQQGMDSAVMVIDSFSKQIPNGYEVSKNFKHYFSEDGQRLFWGISKIPLVEDTLLLDREKVNVEIWSWLDQRLHSQQNAELEKDRKKSYLCYYDIPQQRCIFLGDSIADQVYVTNKGKSDWALAVDHKRYDKLISWEGYPRRYDVYQIEMITGKKNLIIENLKGQVYLSSGGRYIYWYNAEDSIWYAHHNESKKIITLTKGLNVSFADELNDVPNLPYPYGVAGWIEGDDKVLIYDRYDIWEIDPLNLASRARITKGRNKKIRYRYQDMDPEDPFVEKAFLLHCFNETDKSEGFSRINVDRSLNNLIKEKRKIRWIKKAYDDDLIVFSSEDFNTFSDLRGTSDAFESTYDLSEANPQQKEFLWGSVELTSWTLLNGSKLEGLLYKPEQFDAQKEYPLLVYFYERNSDNLHLHRGVVPHRSIINPAFYTSRGYLVFIPDIVYQEGQPGESCYKAIMPGIDHLIDQGYVDTSRIGVQGHSWGGYQVAYLVTKTNRFKCAEAGAPVSNMISAYGGIRWQTGLSRMFQYEKTQSRLGKTLWNAPNAYIENSPIFYLDKVNTPLLIMHNDKDGHVPWYQGIELFVGLRRLNKPAWMLNYNDEPHWPIKRENIIDFNVRMQQFFDHYLLGASCPDWMQKGIPAIEKGLNKGY